MKFPLCFLPLALLWLSACAPTTQYYVLSAAGSAPAGGLLTLGVGPVTLAPYLTERPNLVFKSSANRLEFSTEHEWAGELEDDFTRVLGIGLGRHVGTGRIRYYPWDRESELDYQITVDVTRLHGTHDGEAVLEAAWRVYALPESRLIASRNTTLREDLQVDGFEELAAAESRLIDRLADVIARSLKFP
ncbi:MAG: PqiC family protein [Verrucomicrobiota bacterium JB023]|nr:PqiC family protein [Verrucomicrobiota bacterium JB023]